MIAGIGTDLVALARMEKALARHGQRLVQRLLGDQEQRALDLSREPARFLAKRFAAKEAVCKALGTGLRGMRWTDIQVLHSAQGQPQVSLSGGAARQARALGIVRWHLSVADERDQALAFAIAETEG